MSRSRAKRPVRSPFVITLAAAAAMLTPGCGARIDAASTGDAGPDVGSDTETPGCPATAPASGEPCAGNLGCNYDPCGPTTSTHARCEKGQWQVLYSSCNPPRPACPFSEPEPGTSCFDGGIPLQCRYADRCVAGAEKSYSCVGAKWALDRMPAPAACPTSPPVDGTSCEACAGRYPSTCVYEYCGTFPSRESICNPPTKTWATRWSSCNPPPPDSGPPEEVSGEDAGSFEEEVPPSP